MSGYQIRFNIEDIYEIQEHFGLTWECLTVGMRREHEKEWILNLTRVIDALTQWCKDNGIRQYWFGYTQIELCVTFQEKKDAMLFKLRWHNGKRS